MLCDNVKQLCMLVLALAMLEACSWGACKSSDVSVSSKIQAIVQDIRAGNLDGKTGELENLAREVGPDIIPELARFIEDEDYHVRACITITLGELCDGSTIPLLVGRLQDKEFNVRRPAIDALYYYPREALMKQRRFLLDPLARYAVMKELIGYNYKAILLIGDLGGKSKMGDIHKVLASVATREQTPNVQRVREACVKALFKLGDKKAADEVLASLSQYDDVSKRVFGIESVQYAGRLEFVSALVPLLDDTRDPKPFRYVEFDMRVRDLVINTIAEITKIKLSFKVPGARYTNEQAQEVRKRVAGIAK